MDVLGCRFFALGCSICVFIRAVGCGVHVGRLKECWMIVLGICGPLLPALKYMLVVN